MKENKEKLKELKEMIEDLNPVVNSLVGDEYSCFDTYRSNYMWAVNRFLEHNIEIHSDFFEYVFTKDFTTYMDFFAYQNILSSIANCLDNMDLAQERLS